MQLCKKVMKYRKWVANKRQRVAWTPRYHVGCTSYSAEEMSTSSPGKGLL